MAQIDPDRPWEHPNASEWDTITWDAWLRQQTDDDEAVRNLAFATGSAIALNFAICVCDNGVNSLAI